MNIYHGSHITWGCLTPSVQSSGCLEPTEPHSPHLIYSGWEKAVRPNVSRRQSPFLYYYLWLSSHILSPHPATTLFHLLLNSFFSRTQRLKEVCISKAISVLLSLCPSFFLSPFPFFPFSLFDSAKNWPNCHNMLYKGKLSHETFSFPWV